MAGGVCTGSIGFGSEKNLSLLAERGTAARIPAPRMSSPSTTSAARASNGSKRARTRLSLSVLRRQRGSPPASRARLRSRQLPARCSATPEPMSDWSMTTLREKLIKIGTKVVGHARYVAFQMANRRPPESLRRSCGTDDRGIAAATDHIDCVVHSNVACPIENDGKGAAFSMTANSVIFSSPTPAQPPSKRAKAGEYRHGLVKNHRSGRKWLNPA